MTALQLRRHRQRQQAVLRRQRSERRGSTLLIVLVLMAMLASLGVIFYVFAAQERASANFYSDAAKVKQFDISADTLFDFGVRQLIEGPEIGKFRNSALSNRRHALLPNMLGLGTDGKKLDFAPYNGMAFVPADLLYTSINDSDGANPNQMKRPQDLANRDPDYTYPDNNNVFLHYDGYEPFGTGYAGGSNDGALGRRRIIIPSFHRPQNATIKGTHATPWFTSAPANEVLRPHLGHQYVGSQGPTGTSRYLTDAAAQALWGTNVVGFPITPPWDPNLPVPPPIGSRTLQRGQQGVWSLGGPPTATTTIAYEYDVDNDLDGVWEGVWLDLDFPPLEDASGQLYVPMFSFTVKDADALLNLNVHGNMARVWNADVNLDSAPYRGTPADPFISKSNQGLYASEVNPLWALNRRPPVTGGSILAGNYDGTYSPDPFFNGYVGSGGPENWKEAANRDWTYLLMGRYTTSPSDLVPGRWGEEHLLYRAITNGSNLKPRYFSVDPATPLNNPSLLTDPWPGPGQTQYDDNGDRLKIAGDFFGSAYQTFGKPLDYTGLGSYWNSASPKQGNYGTSGSSRWPLFNRYSVNSQASAVQWPTSGLSNSVLFEGLFNDAGEMVLDADAKKDEDELFGAEEMRALHLSPTDFADTTGGQSRITQLAPYNFNATVAAINSGDNLRSTQELRSKFTTRSWDRKQHAVGFHSTRTWEFNADADSDGKQEFPPRFGDTTSPAPYSSTEFYRPVLRRLIEVERDNFDQPRYQMRLNLNQLLVGPNGNPFPSVSSNQLPPNIQLSYRPLTPHPDQTALGAAAVGSQSPNYPANGNFASPVQQEYWARRDRQIMARDIFALLYTLCWPDNVNPTTTSFGADPANRQMIRQFAQYAVNLVDSLDRDTISTQFECDINPTNGWGMNDDPYENTGDTQPSDRFVVFGVERTGLTLSEAAAVHIESASSNLGFTQWDDTDDTSFDNQHFSYVELQNPGPGDVSFTNRAWRVEVGPDNSSVTTVPAGERSTVRRLDLRAGSVPEGTLYTIGSVDNSPGGTNPSIMKVGVTGSAPSDWDADTTSWIMPAQQPLNLDLKNAAQTTNYVLTDAAGTTVPTGALYDDLLFQKVQTTPLYFRLYRRLSPDRPFPSSAAEEADNPWILVDEIAIHHTTVTADSTTMSSGPCGRVTFASGDTGADITAKLRNLRSRERAQPFSTHDLNGYVFHNVPAASPYGNTLAANNGNSPGAFTNWQKVFDRDFASVGELLHVTLGGYSDIEGLQTAPVALGRAPLPGLATSLDLNGNYLTLTSNTFAPATPSRPETIPSDAEILFRPTVMPNGGSGAATSASRWHRLLDIVEVPSRMQAAIPGFPNPVDYPRVAGKLNINTLRHPENLAAAMDDPSVMNLQVDEDFNLNGALDGTEDSTSNNGTTGQLDILHPPRLWRTDNGTPYESWWAALLASRDGGRNGSGVATFDPITNLYLPGMSTSVPFRGFSQASGALGTVIPQYASIEHTLLRSWPGDSYPANDTSPNQPRQIWELGTLNEHRGNDGAMTPAPVATLDPHVKARLLNKLMNHFTTRSNVFVVFASVKYFRANRTATGAVQIGGPLKPFDVTTNMPTLPPDRTDNGWLPEHRRMYVIDRSQIEKAYDPQSGTFNFRALIEFQQDLVGFP